jgi:hypothetical protein
MITENTNYWTHLSACHDLVDVCTLELALAESFKVIAHNKKIKYRVTVVIVSLLYHARQRIAS